jgi:CMP-N-acetylneuraminic acid synthetase
MGLKKHTAFIFARGGSKGVKDKNIRLAGGKPLIGHAIDAGLGSKYIARVIVSTDSERIAEVARKFGAEVLIRPENLAGDKSPEVEAWRHAINSSPELYEGEDPSLFISLPPTAPLRNSQDVDNAVESYYAKECDIVMGISPSATNPYFTMVTVDEEGLIHICIKGSTAFNRQEIPSVYDIVGGVYVTTPKYVQVCTRLIDGRVGHFIIPPERAMDVDSEYDLHMVDLMLKYPYKGAA